MKIIIGVLLSILIISCLPKRIENSKIQWYKNQIINQIIKETDTTYTVQIGILAQAFHLDRKTKGSESKLRLLQESLSTKKPLTIGVEKGTAQILSVKKYN